MPEPPHVSLWTRYVLENPWPLGLLLLLAGLVIGWTALREGRLTQLRAAIPAGAIGLVVIVTGLLVQTSGERAKAVTKRLVEAAVAQDVQAGMRLFTPDASMSIGSPTNPGFDIDYIRQQLSGLAGSYAITHNRITKLRGYSEGADRAIVHLACWTEVEGGYGPTPSQWVLGVRHQDDGSWRIARITCISISGQAPSSQWLW